MTSLSPLSYKMDFFFFTGSEIGFVKLTDDTVTRLVRSCSDLKSIGGICDWKIRDLLTLLTSLMQEGGWKITLENNHQSSTT